MIDQTSQFFAILTNVGAAKQANADALGTAWKITQMGVGDANGTDPVPNGSQKSLINEWRRAPLNQLKVDPNNASIIIAEQVIPADVGGKWIREIGLYDEAGDLVAVANCAPSFKPLLTQGSGKTQVVRMNLIVSNSAVVELKIDPSVVLATKEFVLDELAKQDFKHSVLVATTGNITLSGLQTCDGVAIPSGKRVLVRAQSVASQNGIYSASGGAWIRSTDANTNDKVTPGMLVHVEQGALYGDSAWQLVTDGAVALGVTGLTFEMAYGRTGIAAGSYRTVTVDKYGRVVAGTNPTTAAGYGLTDVYTKSEVYSKSETYGKSEVFTKTETAKAVSDAISTLVGNAPAALDQLNELAAALGNDPNYATTMLSKLAEKAPTSSPKLTGIAEAPTPAVGTNNNQIATMAALLQGLAAVGLGTSAAMLAADCDAITASGFYYVLSASTLNLPSGLGNGFLLHFPWGSSSTALQIAVAAGGAFNVKVRNKTSGSWNAWQDFASLASPAFSGNPTAPTAAVDDNDTSIATTGFVRTVLAKYGIGTSDLPDLLAVDVNKVIESGTYQVGAGSTGSAGGYVAGILIVATNAQYYGQQLFLPQATSKMYQRFSNGMSNGSIIWSEWKEYAGLDSPVLTGDPKAPTPSVGDNDKSIATTEFVQSALANYGIGVTAPAALTLNNNLEWAKPQGWSGFINVGASKAKGVTVPLDSAGSSPSYGMWTIIGRRDNSSGFTGIFSDYANGRTWIGYAPVGGQETGFVEISRLDSPGLVGAPTAPTPPAASNNKRIATTEFVASEVARLKAIVRFTTNGTWLCPDGVTEIVLSGCAGGSGGCGGAGYGQTTGAGGGSGGPAGQSVVRQAFTVVPGTTYEVVIGAGGYAGLGGASGLSGSVGGNGGVTKFGTLLTLSGGGTGSPGYIQSGAGGIVNAGGASCGTDAKGAGLGGDGGSGGSGPFGTAGGAGRAGEGGGTPGTPGSGYGAGGGGGGAGYKVSASGGNGSTGRPGLLILEY